MELVALGAIGALAVVALVVLVVRLRSSGNEVLGTPPPVGAVPPTAGPVSEARRPRRDRRPFTPLGGALAGMGSLREVVSQLQEAMADGNLSDEELARIFPGATVVRRGDEVEVQHESGWGALDWDDADQHHHVEWTVGPVATSTTVMVDGQSVDDPSQIQDPAVRAKVEQVLRQLGR